MGFFGGINNTLKKAEAAVIVQNLLEIQVKAGTLPVDSKVLYELSKKLINSAWEEKPDIFGGSFGQRPYKISVAAAAFACGIRVLDNAYFAPS